MRALRVCFAAEPGPETHGGRRKWSIEPLPYRQTIEELDANIVICPPEEMVDRLAPYHEAGIDEFILSSNLGQPQEEHIEAMERFAAQVMPHFSGNREPGARESAA